MIVRRVREEEVGIIQVVWIGTSYENENEKEKKKRFTRR